MIAKNPSLLLIWLSVAFLSLIWGSTWLAIKIGLTDAPPVFSAALRFVIASAFLLFYMKFKKMQFPKNMAFWRRSILLALFMFVIPYGFVYWGEMYISSGLSSVLFSSQSLFVVLFAHYMLKNEKATIIKWLGVLTGMCGLLYIFYYRFDISSDFGILGMAGLLIAALSAGFALVWLKKTGESTNHISELTAQIIITAIFFIPISLSLEELPQNLFAVNMWLCVAYLAIIGTAVAFLVYYWLAKHTTALILSFSIYFTPILALFLGWAVLGEYVGKSDITGTLIVIGSIILTQMPVRLKQVKSQSDFCIINELRK